MPDYAVDEVRVEVARNAILLDTNVLIEAFAGEPGSSHREYAEFMLFDADYSLLISNVVVVEAWGMIVGSRRDYSAGYTMLAWLNSPGRVTFVPRSTNGVSGVNSLIRSLSIDFVDAVLAETATDITRHCRLKPALRIATFDTRDFARMVTQPSLAMELIDLRSGLPDS